MYYRLCTSCFGVCCLFCASCTERSTERKTTPFLQDWNEGKLVTVEFKNVPFAAARDLFSKQTGVKLWGWDSKKINISLKLDKVPFWKAVSELSIAAKSSFHIWQGSGEEPEIRFDSRFPPFDDFQFIGKFSITL
jgi:hypothetical protein